MSTDEKSEVAALREELATTQLNLSIEQAKLGQVRACLAAAEQRNSDTIAKLEMAASMMDDDERGNRFAEVCRLAIKSLKPAESGAKCTCWLQPQEPQCTNCPNQTRGCKP